MRRNAIINLVLMICAALPAVSVQAQSPTTVEVARFSISEPGASLPDGWKPLTFKKIPKHSKPQLRNRNVMLSRESREMATLLWKSRFLAIYP
ncbi:MAG: hypothetical protein E8D48_06820 [Nitrospira sp.]|nr:MAG: hypothetical protein E8D48_06820 [Nitrospira sp.]